MSRLPFATCLLLLLGCDNSAPGPPPVIPKTAADTSPRVGIVAPDEGFAASEIKWESVFGQRENGNNDLYCLMGSGFFIAEQSNDFDDVVQAWLTKHNDARALPVLSIPHMEELTGAGELMYVWISDRKENLNLHLVRQGCCVAGTMSTVFGTIHLSQARFGAFEKAAAAAETAAKEEKLGIWGTTRYLNKTARENAEAFMKQGDYRAAIEEFEKINEASRSSFTWLDMAKCQDRSGNYIEALALYDILR